MADSTTPTQVFRLPRITFLVVLFLLVGAFPLALTTSGGEGAPAQVGLQTLIFLVPVLAAVYVARTATVVDAAGISVRAAFGSRALPWAQVRGLSVTGRNVYAVQSDGSVRLPCVRVNDLAALARASGGRLPAIAQPTPKYAPQRRRR
ncbi:PH domain-containing protein [uncultured Jatrophihabitans sp.]|uniref:PH domain-containing protein n=1 Tax=uncultured Jatrophihabitans sp. TaxID=1610747 RepID=UPI0035C9AF63